MRDRGSLTHLPGLRQPLASRVDADRPFPNQGDGLAPDSAHESIEHDGRWQLGRRPALDGLRGIAIILVMCFHIGVPFMDGGGPVGVTAFFTLSGFLITSLLLDENYRTHRVSLSGFYGRRARRLAPAVLTVTLIVVLLIPLFGPHWFNVHALPAVVLYYGNWLQLHGPNSGLAAMGVTWSLAVEEQFYVIWPIIVIAILKIARRETVAIIALGGAVASLMIRIHMITTGATQEQIYFPTSTNALPLLMGSSLAALLSSRGPIRHWPTAVPGIVLLLWPVVWVGALAHKVGPPLVAIATTLVLISVSGPSTHRVLGSAVLRWIGDRSYGMYLIHGPVTVLLRNIWHWPTISIFVVTVPLTLVLSDASYRWVEKPFRRGFSTLTT